MQSESERDRERQGEREKWKECILNPKTKGEKRAN